MSYYSYFVIGIRLQLHVQYMRVASILYIFNVVLSISNNCSGLLDACGVSP
jgi:hypothetical protein